MPLNLMPEVMRDKRQNLTFWMGEVFDAGDTAHCHTVSNRPTLTSGEDNVAFCSFVARKAAATGITGAAACCPSGVPERPG